MYDQVNGIVVVPDDIFKAQSLPFPQRMFVKFATFTFLFTKLAWLSDKIRQSPQTGVVFSVSPFISTVGVTATGILEASKPICCHKVPVMRTSLPLASVATTAFAVNPVLVPHAMLSLVLERVLIELVLPAMRPESVSSADLIAPDIDPRVNI